MSEGTRIEGSSPDRATASTFSEDEERIVKHSSAQSATAEKQVQTDAAIKAAERESEQAQVDVARGRKTYEGTTIKARNPIIVTMLIMNVVTDALKDSADKTKEITKLEKRIWKHHSDGQSDNYKKGESVQSHMMYANLGKGVLSLAAKKYGDADYLLSNYVTWNAQPLIHAVTALNGGSSACEAYSSSVLSQKQYEIQMDDSKFQFRVGHTGSDYQNQSQQVSSDNQMVDSAREKGVQLSRLMVQLITAQPA